MSQVIESIQEELYAAQQPPWDDPQQVELVRGVLAAASTLLEVDHILNLRNALATVAAGNAMVLQAGDCAEDPNECTPSHVRSKLALIDSLADEMSLRFQKPVIRVGRIAGQFAKPRSTAFESVGDSILPSYRGHMVNQPGFDIESRRPDPLRMLMCYLASREVLSEIHAHNQIQTNSWNHMHTSHEALILDYEVPSLRESQFGAYLSSTHWPWIGERTRQVDGAHVKLCSDIINPVAVKVGPTMNVDTIQELCERLDPTREGGRLTLIARMGSTSVMERLPDLMGAVRDAGHPVIWLCDPMHGNTVKRGDGTKTRLVTEIVDEVSQFVEISHSLGVVPHGLHLETTPKEVLECTDTFANIDNVSDRSTLCDPRLNSDQAAEVITAWSNAVTHAASPKSADR